MVEQIRVTSASRMLDETLMKHFELRHGNDLSMKFAPEPDREERRLTEPEIWRTFHSTQHRLYPHDYDHVHNEEA